MIHEIRLWKLHVDKKENRSSFALTYPRAYTRVCKYARAVREMDVIYAEVGKELRWLCKILLILVSEILSVRRTDTCARVCTHTGVSERLFVSSSLSLLSFFSCISAFSVSYFALLLHWRLLRSDFLWFPDNQQWYRIFYTNYFLLTDVSFDCKVLVYRLQKIALYVERFFMDLHVRFASDESCHFVTKIG